MEKTHWKKYNNPDYLGAYAFQPGEEKTVTIKEVKREMVFNPSGSGKEECTVAHFVEDVKPLILNVTNCKTISKVWGTPYIEDWAGRKITLKVKKSPHLAKWWMRSGYHRTDRRKRKSSARIAGKSLNPFEARRRSKSSRRHPQNTA